MVIILSVIDGSLLYPKLNEKKLECLKSTRTDPSNNKNSLSVFQDPCSSMTKRSDIKSPKSNKARKRTKNVEQKVVNVETQNFEKSIKKLCSRWEMLTFQRD